MENEAPFHLPSSLPASLSASLPASSLAHVVTDPGPLWPLNGAITFENVTMRYREGLKPVLKNMSFSIKARSKVGVVGRTGAGKSSMFLTLFRIVEIDGYDRAFYNSLARENISSGDSHTAGSAVMAEAVEGSCSIPIRDLASAVEEEQAGSARRESHQMTQKQRKEEENKSANKGRILIDGVDIQGLGLHMLRSRLSIIPQDPVLFQGSIRDNLDPFHSHADEVGR